MLQSLLLLLQFPSILIFKNAMIQLLYILLSLKEFSEWVKKTWTFKLHFWTAIFSPKLLQMATVRLQRTKESKMLQPLSTLLPRSKWFLKSPQNSMNTYYVPLQIENTVWKSLQFSVGWNLLSCHKCSRTFLVYHICLYRRGQITRYGY